jgi:hypothetical protein
MSVFADPWFWGLVLTIAFFCFFYCNCCRSPRGVWPRACTVAMLGWCDCLPSWDAQKHKPEPKVECPAAERPLVPLPLQPQYTQYPPQYQQPGYPPPGPYGPSTQHI